MQEAIDSSSRSLWLCLLITLVVGGAGFGFDRVLIREGIPRTDVLVLSNLLTGAVAAVLFYKLDQAARERRERTRHRLHTIAEMNHHIRNALQVITYATATQERTDSLEMIRSSVERIEWSLRAILPEYASEPVERVAGKARSEAGPAA